MDSKDKFGRVPDSVVFCPVSDFAPFAPRLVRIAGFGVLLEFKDMFGVAEDPFDFANCLISRR